MLPHLLIFKFLVFQSGQLGRQLLFPLQLQLTLSFVLFCLMGTSHCRGSSPAPLGSGQAARPAASERVPKEPVLEGVTPGVCPRTPAAQQDLHVPLPAAGPPPAAVPAPPRPRAWLPAAARLAPPRPPPAPRCAARTPAGDKRGAVPRAARRAGPRAAAAPLPAHHLVRPPHSRRAVMATSGAAGRKGTGLVSGGNPPRWLAEGASRASHVTGTGGARPWGRGPACHSPTAVAAQPRELN